MPLVWGVRLLVVIQWKNSTIRSVAYFGDDHLVIIYEVKLGYEFIMSSRFVEGELALANLALDAVPGDNLRVVVGGLGLGYNAEAVLNCDRVSDLIAGTKVSLMLTALF